MPQANKPYCGYSWRSDHLHHWGRLRLTHLSTLDGTTVKFFKWLSRSLSVEVVAAVLLIIAIAAQPLYALYVNSAS